MIRGSPRTLRNTHHAVVMMCYTEIKKIIIKKANKIDLGQTLM